MAATETAADARSLPSAVPGAAAWTLPLLFALGALAIWIAPRPPMIDIAQHAGQVALLRDLILGRSPWASEVRVNLATPYLLGYGLALPLAFVMPVTAALKTVLTAAYAGFLWACVRIGRELGASPKLDGYYAFSFFGFAYGYGMYTFLTAAPVGLALIWLCIRYARQGTVRQGLGLAALGLALLFCHGLIFLLACATGALIVTVRAASLRGLVIRSWPFWVLLAACAAMFVVTRDHETAVNHDFAAQMTFGPWWRRSTTLVTHAFAASHSPWTMLAFFPFASLPLLAGFRPDWRSREAMAIAGVLLAVLLCAPSYAWSTSLLFERFPLFLPPAYAWILRERRAPATALEARLQPHLASLSALLAAAVLAMHLATAVQFAGEQKDFETLLARAEPGQRALGLVFDASSVADHDPELYRNYVAWYQAERQGFVDFNFAFFPPQIARFRPGARPPIPEELALDPALFDWRENRGDRYRYFFVRASGPPPARLFAGAPCPPAQIAAAGKWRLYENRACPGG